MNMSELLDKHNRIVKPDYQCHDVKAFRSWVLNRDNDDYIEIPSNETISGAPYILELED